MMFARTIALVAATITLCAVPMAAQPTRLGPADGHDLPPVDTGRVRVGTRAPDFKLESLSGDTVTLSQFHGQQNVLLVFYRGHW
jgi:cytochrome oxidase Cu insertion factor (SCO1/SenC/PrrC family)